MNKLAVNFGALRGLSDEARITEVVVVMPAAISAQTIIDALDTAPSERADFEDGAGVLTFYPAPGLHLVVLRHWPTEALAGPMGRAA